MRADPKPDDCIFFLNSHCSPTDAHSNRIGGQSLSHPLELETRMARILLPEFVIFSGDALNTLRQFLKTNPKIVGKMRFQSSSNPISLVLPD